MLMKNMTFQDERTGQSRFSPRPDRSSICSQPSHLVFGPLHSSNWYRHSYLAVAQSARRHCRSEIRRAENSTLHFKWWSPLSHGGKRGWRGIQRKFLPLMVNDTLCYVVSPSHLVPKPYAPVKFSSDDTALDRRRRHLQGSEKKWIWSCSWCTFVTGR